MRIFTKQIASYTLALVLINIGQSEVWSQTILSTTSSTLLRGFQSPPNSAKPRTWWHWIGSNVTKDGITKDLEWMKRVGIGGFQAIDVSLGGGQKVEPKTVFMTPAWLDAMRHTASEANRLGLEMTMVTSAGWSETGGPWVKPEEAVKKLVWSETQLAGFKRFTGKLPQPPYVNGPIRNMPRKTFSFGASAQQSHDPTFYKDIIVLAYRTPKDETKLADWRPIITSSAGMINAIALLDDDLTTKASLPVPTAQQSSWIQFEFVKPFTANAFSVALAQTGIFGSSSMRPGAVKVSDDGKTFRTLVSLPGPQHDIRALPVRTFAFPTTTARFFRVEFFPGSGISTVGGPDGGGFGAGAPSSTFDVTEAIFHTGSRVNRWEDKANYAPMFATEQLATSPAPETSVIQTETMIDLTSRMDKEGNLEWDVPAGRWTILRIGYALTGAKNSPAVPAGTGFEVDKLNQKHLESYYRQYTSPIRKAMGDLYGKGLQYFLADSYEADAQNWTDDMIAQFRKRRGYDLTPYLPVLAGRIVRSAEVSDRFLWDFRRTIADLLAENHYQAITSLAHKDGIRVYSEAAGISMPVIQDALLNKARVDIPMGEFGMTQGLSSGATTAWKSPADLETDHAYRGAGDRLNAHQADVREAASAAHTYGKPIVAAESWTGGGYEAPASMKLIGDYWATQGINRFIFHTSAHQPLDTKPGNAMVGTHINRNITWAEQAGPFMAYLARTQYLLQQGRFVADVAYYAGETIPSGVPYWEKIKPEPPIGYDYDFLSTELLLDSLSVKDGDLLLPSGMRYRVLVLPETDQITPRVLIKIRQLVADGATVIGPKPVRSPSLVGYPAVDDEVAKVANEIWGDADGKLIFHHDYNKGRVYWGIPITGALVDKRVAKDVAYNQPHTNTSLSWIHRQTSEADLYFLTNLRSQAEDLTVTFRVTGKLPQLWHANTGETEPVSYTIVNGLTTISLHLDAQESVFVVFEQLASNRQSEIARPERTLVATITGPWRVNFPSDLGAPAMIQLTRLESWTEHENEGVKYFSGTASYTRSILATKSWLRPGTKLILDLGEVRDIAEVSVNGQSLGILWKAPYQVDITQALKPGTNQLVVSVTNQWTNRIAGDRILPAGRKVLSSSGFNGFSEGPTPPLPVSGLLGPVTINAVPARDPQKHDKNH
jgi:hypothetical protein